MDTVNDGVPDAELERALQLSRQQRQRKCIDELNRLLSSSKCEVVPYLALPGGEKISMMAALKMLGVEANISIEVVAR